MGKWKVLVALAALCLTAMPAAAATTAVPSLAEIRIPLKYMPLGWWPKRATT